MGKDIKDYLHLYLGCEVYIFPDDTISDGWLNQRLIEMPNLQWKYEVTIETFKHTLKSGYKPILRPLSDITTNEEKELDELGFRVTFPNAYLRAGDGNSYRNMSVYGTSEATRYLLSKGFDLFGLHEAGLCLYKSDLK